MTIFIIMLAFITGIIWGLYLKFSIVPFLVFLVIIAIFNKSKRNLIILFSIFCLISNIYICTLEKGFINKYKNISGEVTIVGTIIKDAEDKEYNYKYNVKVEKLKFDGKEQKQCEGTYILLKLKKEKTNHIYNYGDKIMLTGEFELPQGQRNYGGFNYREYLKTKNIYGVVISKMSQVRLIKTNNINIVNMFANKVSKKIKENISNMLSEEKASLLTGILIGDKAGISEEIQSDFRDSNLSHMLAISGAHVSYVILGVTFALDKIKIGKRLSKVFTIMFLTFFTILTGATPSVQRASIMAIYILVGNLLYKKPNILISISLSMLILLIQNPYNLLDIGFQLSYGGTIGIVYFYKKIKFKKFKIKILQKVIEMMIITLSANIVIIPIMMLHYNTISFTFLISNVLASPILGIVIILGFIIVLISFILNPLSLLLSKVLSIFLEVLIFVANICSNLPFSKIYVITPSIMQIILYYYAIISKKRFLKICIFTFLVVSLIFVPMLPSELRLYFIDVGQGDSTLIITPKHKSILIDGGGTMDLDTFDVGKNTLIPYLLDRGVSKIDYMMVSHFDSDHVRTECYQ